MGFLCNGHSDLKHISGSLLSYCRLSCFTLNWLVFHWC